MLTVSLLVFCIKRKVNQRGIIILGISSEILVYFNFLFTNDMKMCEKNMKFILIIKYNK